MKKILSKIFIVSFLIINSSYLFAQTNLVLNGSFESYSQCPSTSGQPNYANGWNLLTNTPDYFNICATNTAVSVPINFVGFQVPSSGNAYLGFVSYLSTTSNYREIVCAQLTTSLTIGQKYYVKYKVSPTLDNASNCISNNFAIRFTTVQHNSLSAQPLINNFAQINYTNITNDTANWILIFKSFVADSNYKFIEVGNFFNDANTSILVTRPQGYNMSYYYLDDICVSSDSLYSYNWNGATSVDEVKSEKTEIFFYPNPLNQNRIFVSVDFFTEEIEIINAFGKRIKEIRNISGNTFDLSDIENGIYFIRIKEKNKVCKIIINK